MHRSKLKILPIFTILIQTSLASITGLSAQDADLVFSVMGDIPYESAEEAILQEQIAEHNLYSPSEFMIHVGDIKGTSKSCPESDYEKIAGYLLELNTPTFVLPGDNEWTDCDDPDEAWGFWAKNFMNFERNFCGAPLVAKQAIRPENFAWVTKGVLVIGLNMVGGTTKSNDPDAWDARLQDNADWVNQQFKEHGDNVRAAVIFGHSLRSHDELFELQFEATIEAFGKPSLYIQGEHHSFNHKERFLTDNMSKITVDKGANALPLQITVNSDPVDPFVFEREPWDENSTPVNSNHCSGLTVSPSSYNFGEVEVDSQASRTITITNTGADSYEISGLSLGGSNADQFTLPNPPVPATLDSGQALNITIDFHPSSYGHKEATLTIAGGDPVSTALSVELMGMGHLQAAEDDTPVNFTIAFIADQGLSENSIAVLNLIKGEGAGAVVHAGDFDYGGDPDAWDEMITDVLGADFPYFAALGEDDRGKFDSSDGYQDKLEARMISLGLSWEGDLAVQSSFTYKGIFFIQTAGGVIDGDHADYLRDRLAGTNAVWRLSTFHKNMKKFQLCGMSDSSGWGPYDESRRGGAIITNGQCHVYARTHLMSNFEEQEIASTSDTLRLALDDPATSADEGRTFDAVTGLGGKSRHSQDTDGAWWAAKYSRQQDSRYGALFGVFNYNGHAGLAKFYFKNIDGEIIDSFYVTSPVEPGALLAVTKEGEGTVELTPAGGFYAEDEEVTLEVTPANGWVFTGWEGDLTGSGNPATLTMDSDKNVTARFTLVAPLVASFTPSTGLTGDEVTITGLNFAGAAGVSFNGTPALDFTVDSDTQLRVTVPAGASNGKVTITNSEGTGESNDDFSVILPPTIASFAPAAGPPGTEVTLTGTHFTGVDQLDFNGTPASSFSVISDSEIQAEAPAGARTGPISLSNTAAGVSTSSDFEVTAPPSTLSFTPIEDTRVRSSKPTKNYGSEEFLQIRRSSADHIAYLKFEISGLFGLVQSAKLKMEVTDGGSDGGSIYVVSNNYNGSAEPWTEGGLIWDNAPPLTGSALSTAGAVSLGQIVELDITSAISGNGTYSFAIQNDSDSRIRYSSKEGGTPPELIVEALTTPVPIISSFHPSTGVQGTEVTITGLNCAATLNVAFNGTPASSFTVDSDTQLRVQVPGGASTGKISVTNVDGTGESTTAFTVILPPSITGFSPSSGAVGSQVTISGQHFSRVTDVSIGGTVAPGFTINSDNEIVATVPGGASSGLIEVSNPAGNASSGSPFVVKQIPVISEFSPSGGPVGLEVTLTGSNFTGATEVSFGGTVTSVFNVISASELRVDVPAGASSGKIRVTNADGTGESGADFTVALPPVISSFLPLLGPPGTEVRLSGSSFTSVSEIRFGGTAATFTVDSDTEMRAEVPLGASTGPIAASNTVGDGSSVTDFEVTVAPSIFTFTPVADAYVRSDRSSKNYGGSSTIALKEASSSLRRGYLKFEISGLLGIVLSAKLRLLVDDEGSDGGAIHVVSNGWTESGLTWNNAPVIGGTALSSVGAIDNGDLVEFDVTGGISGNGTYSFGIRSDATDRAKYSSKEGDQAPVLEIELLTTPIPLVLSFSPPSAAAGVEVTLSGLNFTGTSGVTFNGTPASSFTVDSDTQLRAQVPGGAGTGKIGVTNVDGTGESTTDFTVILPPTITGFSPSNGAVGSQVTISGQQFSSATGVTIGGAAAGFTINSDIEIVAPVPGGASTGLIEVSNPAGKTSSGSVFVVMQVPVISSFSPSAGPVGLAVTLTGSNFTGTSEVNFGGTGTSVFNVISASELRVDVPAGASSGKIRVTNADGTGDSGADFTVALPPTISSFLPLLGPPGTEVTLSGSSFTSVSEVRFGGTAAAMFTVDSDTEMRAEVPLGASTGPIGASNTVGDGSSVTDFEVTAAPSIFTFTPVADAYVRSDRSNNNYGGSSTIHLKEASSSLRRGYLKFEISGLLGIVLSAKLRLLVDDEGSDGGAIHVVSNDWTESGLNWNNAPVIGGTALSSVGAIDNGDLVEFDVTGEISGNGTFSFGIQSDATDRAKYSSKEGAQAPVLEIELLTTPIPLVLSFSPSNGVAGVEVTLSGLNFTGTSGVTFNGTPASSFTVDSDTQLRAQVPGGAGTGKISVTNVDGTGESTTDFTVILPPTITGFSPSNGAVGSQVTISGQYFSSVTDVSIGGTVAPGFTINSDIEIVAPVPGGASTGLIEISNPAGKTSSGSAFVVKEIPVISSFSPSGGPVGLAVTLTGSNFTGTSEVNFGSTGTSVFSVISASELRVDVPAGASSGKIRVTNADGTGESGSDFTVALPPTISSFTPLLGPPGTEVTLTGANFTGTSEVTFGGTPASAVTVESDSEVRVEVPAAASTGVIGLSNAAGSTTNATNFEVTAAPSTFTFAPIQDSYVKSDRPTNTYGSSSDIRVKNSSTSVMNSFLKFEITGLVGTVQKATLFLTVDSASDDGGSIHSVSNNFQGTNEAWVEDGLNWGNAPEITNVPLSSLDVVNLSSVVAFDVTLAVGGNGTYSFGIKNNSSDAAKYDSKDSSSPPELVIDMITGGALPKSSASSTELDQVENGSFTSDLPEALSIASIHPNPFNLATTIEYALPKESRVSLVIFNVVGQRVRTLVDGVRPAGFHRIQWFGKDDRGREVATGIYIIQVEANNRRHIRRMTLLK